MLPGTVHKTMSYQESPTMITFRTDRLFLFATLFFLFIGVHISPPSAGAVPEQAPSPDPITDSLTEQEQLWLTRHPVITLSLDERTPPLNYRDEQGNLIGISIDYLQLIEKKLGIRLELVGLAWDEALQKAVNHRVDGIVNAAPRDERKQFLNFTKSYFTAPVALITLKGGKQFANLSELSGMKAVVIKGTVRHDILKDNVPDSEIIEVRDLLEGLKLVSEGKADALFEDLPVAQHMLDNYFFTNMQVALIYYDRVAGESTIGLRNDEPELLSLFNRAISSITPDEHRQIKRKWLRLSDTIQVQRASLLTEAEKRWLEEHPTIRVACDPDWAPIEYLDSEDRFRGISIAYLKILEKKLGVSFQLNGYHSWSKLLDKVRNKELDMVSAISRTAERSRFLEFTAPYLSTPLVIFSRQEIAYIKDLKELIGKRVGVIKGFAIQEWLATDQPSINLIPVENGVEAMTRLQKGELDAFIGNLVSGSYLINKLGYSNIKVAGETPYKNAISLAVRKDWPLLASALQKSFDEITEDERDEIYRNWISIKYEQGTDYTLLVKFLAGFLLVILLFAYWNRRLSHEITERRRAEEEREKLIIELQDALEKVQTLSGLVPICANCKNIRDDKGYWNKIESYLQKYSEVKFSHGICPECAKKLYPDMELYPEK